MKTTRVIFLITILLFLGLTSSPAVAQDDNGIELQVRAGFDGIHKDSGWLTFQVIVSNTGPAVEGFLNITPTNSGPLYQVPISLPTQSNKQVSLPFYQQRISSSYNISLVDEDGNTLERSLTSPLKRLTREELLYAVVSEEPSDFDFLSSIPGPRSSSDASVATLTFSDLPENPNAWSDLDILIINGIDSNQLSTAQREALRTWIGLGGQLVLTGGADWQQSTAAFEDLLPVAVSGSESVADLPALVQDTGEPFRDPGPYVITTSTLSGGQLLYHQEGLPILARRALGRGSVFFLALDPQFAPLKDWDGSDVVWGTISDYVPATPVWSDRQIEENFIQRAVESIPSLSLPSSLFLLAFLAIYTLAVGPLAYMYLKRQQRLERAWFVIPVIILFFSVIAYAFGYQVRGNRALINQISTVYGHLDGPEAEVRTFLGVYSPQRSSYDLVFPDGVYTRPLDNAFTAFGSPINQDVAIISGSDVTIRDVLIDIAGIESFVAESTTPLPAISATASYGQDGTRGELTILVTNNTDTTLEDATLLIGPGSIKLGDIAAGETADAVYTLSEGLNRSVLAQFEGLPPSFRANSTDSPIDQHYANLLGQSNYYSEPDVFARYQLLEGLTVNYFSSSGLSYLPETVVTLAGWSEEAQINLDLSGRRHTTSATTLYLLEIPITQ